MLNKEKVVMGIDPGTNKMGYGLIRVCGREAEYIDMGFIAIPAKLDTHEKLGVIFRHVDALIEEHRPAEVAYEAPFCGENVQSMLKLGRAQGVAMAAAIRHGASVYEYSPRKVKLAITGKGGASKEQVASMIRSILKIAEMPENLDASDGLAVALCHHFQSGTNGLTGGGKKSWEDYVRTHPDRIKKCK